MHDPESPYLGQYAKEFVLSLSDWYHDQMTDLLPSFISLYNPTGAEPVPDSALMNDNQNGTFAVEPNTSYMFHIVNVGAFAGQYLWFEGHTMQIVEVDGVWTEAQEAEMIYVTAAQRYSVLVTTKNQTSQNFAIVGSMDQVGYSPNLMLFRVLTLLTGSVRYSPTRSQPKCHDLAPIQLFRRLDAGHRARRLR